jgi:hypothetical protein
MFHDRGHGSPLLVTRHLDWGYGTVIVDLLELETGVLRADIFHTAYVLACYALLRDGEEVA